MPRLMESDPSFTADKTPVRFADAVNISSGPDAVDIDDLVRRVSRLVKRETNLGVQEMQIVFKDGQLILSGYCRTFYTKQLAQQAVVSVIGNTELVNNIRVV